MGNGVMTGQVRTILTAAAVVAALVAVTALLVVRGATGMVTPGGVPTFVAGADPMPLNTPSSFSFILVEAPTASAIRVTGVRINATDNVRFLGAVAVPVGARPTTGGAADDPPPSLADASAHTVEGEGARPFEVPAGERSEVTIALALTAGDLGGVNGIWVEVERDGRTEEQYFPHGLLLPREGADVALTDSTAALRSLGLIDTPDA